MLKCGFCNDNSYEFKMEVLSMNIIVALIVGGISGWLAGHIMGTSFSFWGNIGIGIIGGVVGNVLLSVVGIHGSGMIGNIIVAVIGACAFIAIVRQIKK